MTSTTENAVTASPAGKGKLAYTLEEVAAASDKSVDDVRRLVGQSVVGGPILDALMAMDAGEIEEAKKCLVAALENSYTVLAGQELCLTSEGVGLAR